MINFLRLFTLFYLGLHFAHASNVAEYDCLKELINELGSNDTDTIYIPEQEIIILTNQGKEKKDFFIFTNDQIYSAPLPNELSDMALSYDRKFQAFQIRRDLENISKYDPTKILSSSFKKANMAAFYDLQHEGSIRHHFELKVPNKDSVYFYFILLHKGQLWRNKHTKQADFYVLAQQQKDPLFNEQVHSILLEFIETRFQIYKSYIYAGINLNSDQQDLFTDFIKTLKTCNKVNNTQLQDTTDYAIKTLQKKLTYQRAKDQLIKQLKKSD